MFEANEMHWVLKVDLREKESDNVILKGMVQLGCRFNYQRHG
jgi:hypothetical protein